MPETGVQIVGIPPVGRGICLLWGIQTYEMSALIEIVGVFT